MVFELLDDNYNFPSAELSEPEGLLAIGGDLSPLRLLTAYANGIFPWYNEGEPILWWSLDPRLVIRPGEKLIDCQQETPHLKSLGAYPIPRRDFLEELETLVVEPGLIGSWDNTLH